MGPARRLRIVLVRPRDPNNIGAAARAMANFGLAELRVVAPHPPVWRQAKSAVGAWHLLGAAVEVPDIPSAVVGCRAVWGSSAVKSRRPRVPVLSLPSAAWPGGSLAVLFGPEKTGLTGDDLAYCSAILRVPTVSACSSMNLAAAVAVVSYQWSLGLEAVGDPLAKPGPTPAVAEQKQRLWEALRSVAERAGWPAGERHRRLQAAVFRSNLSEAEAGMALELLRRSRPRRG